MLLETVRSFFFSGRAADELPRLREAALFGLSELRGAEGKKEEEMWDMEALGGTASGRDLGWV